MVFHSHKDRWLSITMWSTILIMIVTGSITWFDSDIPFIASLIFFLIMWSTAIFLSWMWLTTCYVMHDDHLLIRFGPFKLRIPYEAIRKIKRTRSILSSPALSTRRLEIQYHRFDMTYISPADEERMLKLLRERCPRAQFDIDVN